MALVVFLKGVNVGGHRTFRPSALASRLRRFGAVNVGTAGTFVVEKSVRRGELRATIQRLVPFDVAIVICEGRDILELTSRDRFASQPSAPDIIHFVSVQAKRRQLQLAPPFDIPAEGRWSVRVLTHQKRFVLGLHRREMRAIACLGRLEKLAGGPIATRAWTTILAVARLLHGRTGDSLRPSRRAH
jgi:uncharacterized protein (DUF1697 family)